MKQYQCPRFHLYTAPEGHGDSCPVCAAQDAELSTKLTQTRGIWATDPATHDPNLTVQPRLDKKTVGVYAHLGAPVEPVVGWLACIAGPEQGRDWRLVSGRNAIGRGDGMAVRLGADASVSRDRHAVLSFDPRRGSFSLAPGEGQGLVYCNAQEVVVPVTLAAFDRIEVGASTLVFVPLVGEHFSWPA